MSGISEALGKAVNTTKGAAGILAQDQADSAGIKATMDNVNAVSGSGIAPTPAAKPYVQSPKDRINPKATYGSKAGEKRIDTSKMTKTLGSYKKGGKVTKTGIAKLHGSKKNPERVLNAKQNKQLEGLAKGLSK